MKNTNLFYQVANNQMPIENLIGSFLNRYSYSDVNPVGQVIGVKGKKTLILRKVNATNNKTKMEFVPGGFSCMCTNQWDQDWEFEILDETFEMRVCKKCTRQLEASDMPIKYYDYNF